MKCASLITAIVLALYGSQATAQGNDLEARIDELEAALDHLQGRIERLEEQQAPRRVSEAEAEAILKKKQAEEECTAELGPAPEFAPVLGTKVNPDFMAYLKEHRACMRDKGVP
jgi:TolA-binding protein